MEFENIKSEEDLYLYAISGKTPTLSQKYSLAKKLGISENQINQVVKSAPDVTDRDYNRQLEREDAFIRNVVNNNIEKYKLEQANKDTRSQVQKETDYIKQFVEEQLAPADPKDIDYKKQLEEETAYIKNFVETVVQPKVNKKLDENKDSGTVVEEVVEETITGDEGGNGGGISGGTGQIVNSAFTEFNNIPENGLLWNVDGNFYIVYEVPGANGELYAGNPIYMAYELKDNDVFSAGLLTQGETAPQPNAIMNKAFFDSIAIVTGNTDQLSADIGNPFASFVETINEQAQVAPWITDPEMIALIAEAAVEGREVSDAEWQTTNWYQTHNESQREWLRTYYADPSTATQMTTDAQIAVANSLQAAGVSNAPEALINWVAGKFVSGDWSQTYTTEQISLFSDPYATGKRDTEFENYLSSTALTGLDRTTEREREVRELYTKWLGPSLGKLTDKETAEIAGKLRDDPDYEDALIQSLKQSRLAAFSNYTNPELTYEDIARPWRNLTASVWGQTADETQGWWQEMMKSNDFAKAQNTLREKGLELDITQVTQDATQALQQALGQGTVSQTGVNV